MADRSALAAVKAISFDCYGTLIDWSRGLQLALETRAGLAAPEAARLVRRRGEVEWRLLGELEEFVPYRRLLERSIVIAAEEEGLQLPPDAAGAVAASIGDWPPFPDAPPALRRLAGRWPLALVSNVDPEDLDATVARLGVPFARRVTAADVRTYKPDPDHILALLHEMALDEFELLHVSAYADYDLATAQDLGVPAVYVDRYGRPLPEDVEVLFTVRDMEELARALTGPAPRQPRRGGPGFRPRAGERRKP
ncbi:MAG: HAD family hydrolase [Acidobacteria bacterium]|nr:MAG: HAD family hydrolase [Acidobacteriota bacterium]